jgi:exodeoxyribonuclease V beta subunit
VSAAIRVPRPSVLASIPRDRPAVIEASAGTGKTFTLEHLVVELLLTTEARIENLLVVTFTEKATAELVARVRAKIEQLLAAGTRDDALLTPPERSWLIDDEARARLRRALTAFDTATISTIHAFCQRLLVEQAFANRRLFEQQQVDERAAFSTVFKDVLRRELARASELKPYIAACIEAGFTVEGIERLLHAAASARGELRPSFDAARLSAALAAFPVEAASEMHRMGVALRDAGLHHSTVRAVLERLGRVARLVAEERDPARFLLAVEREEATAKTFATLRERLAGGILALDGEAARVQAAFAALDAATVPLGAALAQACLPLVTDRLVRHKREAGLYDFQDMLSEVAAGLDGPRGPELVRHLRARYRFALIDEFQDTDEVQWRIFRRIFFESGGTNPVYVIGDPKQAIYGFRGADVQTYLAATDEIRRSGGGFVALERNFRSTAPMIAACNQIFDQNAAQPFFDGAIKYERPVAPGAERATPATAPLRLWSLTATSAGAARRLLAHKIAHEIRALLDGGLQAGEIFVLTRTAAEGFELGAVLRRAGVPFAYYKQDGLFQTEEAEHVRALLAAIAEPELRARRFQAWATPFFGLSLDELDAAAELAPGHPLVARLLEWKALADAGDFHQLFARVLGDSGIVRRLLFLDESERELTNYLHIFEVLLEEATRSGAGLRELGWALAGFIDGSRVPSGPGEDGNVQRLESERAAVQIMTMHKAKGLEAEAVFLFGGMSDRREEVNGVRAFHDGGRRVAWVGRPPSTVQARVERERDEEDQRLLYVALTRARSRLYLPLFPAVVDGGTPWRGFGGCYRQLNARLARMLPALDARLFAVEEVAEAAAPAAAPAATSGALTDWRLPRVLVTDDDREVELAALRQRHAGFVVTSYTRMKGGAYQPPVEPADFAREAGSGLRVAPDELPGGALSGVCLHELLQLVPLAPLASRPPLVEWSARPEVRALFADGLRRYDRDPRHVAHAQRLVHAALTTRVGLGSRSLPSLASAVRTAREVEFVFPVEDKGFVKGFVDLVFEHEGLCYFADWKSDLLPGYDLQTIAIHVEQNYRVQAQLYALALVKMLRVSTEEEYEARFGGLLYWFLRAAEAGVRFERPAWREIVAWEAQLVETIA